MYALTVCKNVTAVDVPKAEQERVPCHILTATGPISLFPKAGMGLQTAAM